MTGTWFKLEENCELSNIIITNISNYKLIIIIIKMSLVKLRNVMKTY